MSQSVICPQGHRFPVEEPPGEADVVCPECGSRCDAVSPDNGSARPRGLWGVMKSETASSDPDAGGVRVAGSGSPAEAPKGLWALMGKPATPASPAVDEMIAAPPLEASPDEIPGISENPGDLPPAKGLWALMGGGAKAAPAMETQPDLASSSGNALPEFHAVEIGELRPAGRLSKPSVETADEDEPRTTADETHTTDGLESRPTAEEALVESELDELEVAPLESPADDETEGIAAAEPPPSVEPTFTPQRSRGAVRSAILGGVAVLASGMALLPELYAKIPGTLVGFLALMVGLLAMGEIRRSRGRQTGRNWAGAGITLGILGMLLGPFVFSPLGGELRLRYGRRQTANNLERIGEALNAYYRDHDHFPPGSTHQQKKGGADVPLHNWTTMLLPYLGEDEANLFQKIDLKLPYNHEANRRVMERSVDAFYASGASRQKTQGGFAVTHFAALGGTLDVENVGRVNVGIFGRNSRVRRSDVTDGLEQTLVAGEIAFDFPAWGEPDQYRRIGKGLNKGRDGFGNADRTGAMFLRADGSVKFLSNKVDLGVLRGLSTRNGRENVDRLSY
jgi:Protein of unknown function (DUF1559)